MKFSGPFFLSFLPSESDEEKAPMTSHQKTHAKLDRKPSDQNNNEEDTDDIPSDRKWVHPLKIAQLPCFLLGLFEISQEVTNSIYILFYNCRQSLTHREALFGSSNSEEIHRKQYSTFRWMYADGFIQLKASPNFVIGIAEVSVFLVIECWISL